MKKIYKDIRKLALKYQDFRDDKGHAKITLNFAQKLLKPGTGDPDVIIPAIILHDTGYSQLSKKERFLIFKADRTEKEERDVRIKHQKEGCRIAETILKKVNYDKKLSKHIIEIISQHDTRVGFFSKEDVLMRDADKLWRFSKTGFWADVKRFKILAQEHYNRLERDLNTRRFMFTASAKTIAKQELNQRKKEIKNRGEF